MFRKTSQRFLSLLVVTTFLFSFSKPVYQSDFSGTWKLNEGKSELGQFGARGVATKIVVEQKSDGITTTRSATNFQGEAVTTTETLTNDGKVSETAGFGGSKKKSTLKWTADGAGFSISSNIAFERDGQTIDIKGTETWSLSADGKTLTLQNAISTPQGEFATKAVYDKQ